MRSISILVLSLIAAAVAGCESDTPRPAPSPQPAPAAPPTQPAVAPAAPAPAETVQKPAAVGMGEKGRGYGEGIIATPIKALWATREQLVLIQIQDALRIYKALDSQGHGPKNHQEFMEKIIKENHIQLPVLPPGHRYVYDPVKEELMVEQPKP